MTTLHKRFKGKIIVTLICKSVSTVVFTSVKDEFVLQKKRNHVETVAAFELRERLDQWNWNELMVLHTHLDCSQHAEMVLCQIVN